MSDRTFEGWTVVFKTGTDYEADLVRDRLDDAGIPAVVLTQRDHAFNLTVGDLAPVNVLVPPEYVDDVTEIFESEPFTDEELNEAAMSADPEALPAHDLVEEAMLDSGIEKINFSGPEEEESEGEEGEEKPE